MNPPLRTRADRYELIEGIKDGTIDIIATDHAPHSKEEKERPFTEAPSGIIGLETALGLGITKLVRKGHVTVMQLMEKMSLNPAKLYNLNKGYIEEGSRCRSGHLQRGRAVDRGRSFCLQSLQFSFYRRETVWQGKYTICRGKIVYEDGEEK